MDDSFDEQLTQMFEDLELHNSPEACQVAYEVLEKLLINIVQNPEDDRYRVLKKRNKVVQKKLLPCSGIIGLFNFLGFTNLDQDNLIFKGENFADLEIAIVIANSRAPGLKDALKKQEADRRMEEKLSQNSISFGQEETKPLFGQANKAPRPSFRPTISKDLP